jgi:hypothetical protein
MNRQISAKAIQRGLLMGALLLSATAASAQTQVTFQVDMTAQATAGTFAYGTTVTANGTFNGWGAFTLTNNPSGVNTNLYIGTFDDTNDANGHVVIFKYVAGGTYENTGDGDNRCAQLPASGGSLLLPAVFFDDAGPGVTANVTFQVDMAEQINLGAFTNDVSTVEVRGSFNGWTGGDTLLNDPTILTTNATGIVTSNVYVGTFAVDGSTNGTEEYKYVMQPGTVYEAPSSSDSDYDNSENRFFVNATETLPIVSFSDIPLTVSVSNNVTFEVDMTEQITAGNFTSNNNTVEIHGDFNNWGAGQTMTNNANSSTPNIFSTEITYVGGAGTQHYFKYVIQPGTVWENVSASNSIGGNRWFDQPNTNGNFVVGPVYFSDQAPAQTVTNNITFEIDMTTQIEAGSFTTNNNTVEIHGDFNNWGGGQTMTNNANSSTPNIFSTEITYAGGAGAQHYFKYVIQPGTEWENVSAANSIGGNRWFDLFSPSGNYIVGPVYYSDEPPSALIDFVTVTNCMVTFTVNMTNAVGTDAVVFDPTSDMVYLNGLNGGVNNSFWSWGALQPSTYQMTQIGSSLLYTITVPVNRGQNMQLIYKYGINGNDDEAGFGDNHERWIRSLPNYTMPVDVFGSQGATTQTEIGFGNLVIATATNNQIQVSWLGRRGVEVQTTTNLSSAVWTSQPLTDGTNLLVAPGGTASTNYAIGAGSLFYRLVGPQ